MNDVTEEPIETKRLIQSAQAGDQAAFSTLVRQYYDQMYAYAYKFSGSQQDAEEITQNACIKLANSIQQFGFKAAFTTWLYRLVVNCGIDWYRAHKDAQVTDSTSTSTESLQLAHRETATNGILLQQVLLAIEEFGEGFRETVVLVLGEGLSHREAGEVLNVKESTISWRIHETKKRLKALETLETLEAVKARKARKVLKASEADS